MKDDFLESYNTVEWQRKKNRILERDNYTCQICGDTKSVMQVHHITYKHCNGKAYNAYDGDLITLCKKCHSADDGDHNSFYEGRIILLYGELTESGNPAVLINDETPQDGWEPSNCWELIAFKDKWYDYYHVGFRTKGNWFEQYTGDGVDDEYGFQCGGFYPEDVLDVRPANDEDAEFFIRIFKDAKEYVYKDEFGVWQINEENYNCWVHRLYDDTEKWYLEKYGMTLEQFNENNRLF